MTVKRGNDSGELLVRGIPRCWSPSAPGKKEREKEGEFFLVEDGGHQICYVYKKGLNIWDTGKSSFFLYKYFSGIQNVQLV